MATGINNKLTGQIGEHLVTAVLGTLGYYASPYSGNVPKFDLTAVQAQTLESFPVQVKTSTNGSLVHSKIDKWCEHQIDRDNYQKLGKKLKLNHPEIIWIMVRLGADSIEGSRFFICKESDIQNKIVNRYRNFMEKHDYRRPGGGSSTQAILNVKELSEYENNWDILKYAR